MNWEEIIKILTVLGGFEGFKWLITFWVNRKSNARKEDASADAMVDENYRKQVGGREERVAQRDAKIDALYAELREEQAEKRS